MSTRYDLSTKTIETAIILRDCPSQDTLKNQSRSVFECMSISSTRNIKHLFRPIIVMDGHSVTSDKKDRNKISAKNEEQKIPLIFNAFISYSHGSSSDFVVALHNWLQRIAKPWWHKRSLRIFRDETDLSANPSGINQLCTRLDQSDWLILIATPEAAQSKWVKREVRHWLGEPNVVAIPSKSLDIPIENPDQNKKNKLLIVLAAGEIEWKEPTSNIKGDFDWSKSDAIPLCLRGVFDAEPIWVDVRNIKPPFNRKNKEFINSVARLAAPIRGLDLVDLVGEDVRRHRQTMKLLSSGLIFIVFALAVSIFSIRETSKQQQLADVEKLKAQHSKSLELTSQARLYLTKDSSKALELALAAWPITKGGFVPNSDSAVDAIGEAIRGGAKSRIVINTGYANYDAAFSPDGNLIASAGANGHLRLWSASTGLLVKELNGHRKDKIIWSVAFSPDGESLLSASADGSARIWEISTGASTALNHESGMVYKAVFDKEGGRIITAGEDGTARIWSSKDGSFVTKIKAHEKAVLGVAFSPIKEQIATSSIDGTVKIWDIKTGLQIEYLTHGSMVWVPELEFSKDGKKLLTAAHNKQVHLWELGKKTIDNSFDSHIYAVNSARFSHNGSFFVTSSDDGYIKIWDTKAKKFILDIGQRSLDDRLYSAAFSQDGGRIVTASIGGPIIIWDVDELVMTQSIDANELPVDSARFSSDGRKIYSASYQTIGVWDTSTGARTAYRHTNHYRVWDALMMPNSRDLLVSYSSSSGETPEGQRSYFLQIWNPELDLVTPFIAGHSEFILDISLSPTKDRVITASKDRTARIWDMSTGKELRVFEKHESTVRSAQFSCDGKEVLTASENGSIMIWDAESLAVNVSLNSEKDPVRKVTFSLDCKLVAIGSSNGIIQIWRRSDGQFIHELIGHQKEISSLSFSRDATRILSASRDGTARIWDVETESEIARIDNQQGALWSASFDKSEKRVLTSNGQGKIQTWASNIPEGNFFKIACQMLPIKDGERHHDIKAILSSTTLRYASQIDDCNSYDPPFPNRLIKKKNN